MGTVERYPSPIAAPLSKAVRAGGFLFLSGQTPKNADLTPFRGNVREQTANVLEIIKSTLREFELDLTSVVRCTVWLSDISKMKEFNEVYAAYFDAALPVRSTVEAKLANDIDIEIEVTAWAG